MGRGSPPGVHLVSPLLVEIGVSVVAIGVLVFFLAGPLGGGAAALVIAGVLITVGGFAIGRRED